MQSMSHSRALTMVLAAAIALVSAIAADAQTLPVTYKNSTYMVSYDPAMKLLECSSNNTECVWRTEISRQVPSFSDIAAVATPAGPVIVYSDETGQTHFALPHFRTGSLTVENSGEPLRGVIGRGRLLNCLFQVEQYGAKLVCQLLEPNAGSKMREHSWDVNMWGTHQALAVGDLQEWGSGAMPESGRVQNAALKFQLDVPKGFRHTQVDEVSFAMYGPTNDLFMTVFSDAGASPIEELGEAYMAEMGVEVIHRSVEELDNGEPAYLLMGTGTVNDVQSLHVGVVYSNAAHTWVLSYTGRADLGDLYMGPFMEMMNSFQPLM